jgi:HSP20 family protein
MLTRYDPFREALSLRRAMDQLFEQSVVHPGFMGGSQSMMVPMDICETTNGYEVDIALPGVRPEDIEVTVDQNTLTIRGHYGHQNEHQNQPQTEPVQQQGQPQAGQQGQPYAGQQTQQGQPQAGQQERTARHRQGHTWLSREIVSGRFERSITFPKPIDSNNVQTSFQNGILTLQIPVSEASRPRRISIAGGQSQSQQARVGAGRP